MPSNPALNLDALRRSIRVLERLTALRDRLPILSGEEAIDDALPWRGLARDGLHEIGGDGAAPFGFLAGLIRRVTGDGGTILWCRSKGTARTTGVPYGPGLAPFGLSPGQILFAKTAHPVETLWAMEEGLRCGRLAAVVGEGVSPDLTASRRLQLAAEATGTPAFVVVPPTSKPTLSTALTRWRVTAELSRGRSPRWRLDLWRCRGGNTLEWIVEWDEQALRFRLATALADRTPAAGAG